MSVFDLPYDPVIFLPPARMAFRFITTTSTYEFCQECDVEIVRDPYRLQVTLELSLPLILGGWAIGETGTEHLASHWHFGNHLFHRPWLAICKYSFWGSYGCCEGCRRLLDWLERQ
jgi:hypothetical protein